MAYKPILFSTPMVQAILDNRKTMTRRVVKKKYSNTDLEMKTDKYGTRLIERQNDAPPPEPITFPDGRKGTRWHLVAIRDVPSPYQRGDILWVRETWQQLAPWTDNGCGLDWDKMQYYYAADGNPGIEMTDDNGLPLESFRWRPSIHMPKAATRIFLRVTDVRAERAQDITTEDICNEGVWADPPDIVKGVSFPDDMESWSEERREDWNKSTARAKYIGQCEHIGALHREWVRLWDKLNKEPRPVKKGGKIIGYISYPWKDTRETLEYRGLPWDVYGNPWVWVYTFERVDKPEGWPECV